jgi:hypothetical protein
MYYTLSHSTSRSASEQQEPTDITIVSTNIDEPEPSTAASSTVQEKKLTAKGRKVTCKRTYPQTRKGKGKGKSKRSFPLPSFLELFLFPFL